MKILRSQLRKIIREEVERAIQEQLPPSPEDVSDAYAGSLSGGKFTVDGEERELDRLEEPETQGIMDVLKQLRNPETIELSPGGPEGEDIVEQILAHKGLGPELKPVVLDLFTTKVREALIDPVKGIKMNPDAKDLWGQFKHNLHLMKMSKNWRPARIADVGKERMRAERSALGVIGYIIDLVTRRAERKYQLGGPTGLKDIEGWPEQEAPPSEDEIEDISGTVGHARLGERKKRRRK